MREIKFRAWDKSKNKMFYDVQETSCYWNGVFNPDVIQEDNFGYILDKEDVYELMQFTGLYDKNKVPIYEGDILNIDDEYWVVSFEYGKFVGTFDNVCEDLYEVSDYEVIGNIYENSNLIGDVNGD